jgi:hypothetical protein
MGGISIYVHSDGVVCQVSPFLSILAELEDVPLERGKFNSASDATEQKLSRNAYRLHDEILRKHALGIPDCYVFGRAQNDGKDF